MAEHETEDELTSAPQRATATLSHKASGESESAPERIIDAAARCFARWGISRTRMEDVATEAGIARPHIYRHFASKDALIHAVLLQGIRHHYRHLAARFPLEGPAADVIVRSLVRGIVDAGDYIYTGPMVEQAEITAEQLASSEEILAEMRKHWEPVLEYAAERGELREGVDIDAAARWLTYIQFRYLALPALTPDPPDLERELRAFVLPALVTSERPASS